MSAVIAMLACPRSSETALRWTPFSSHVVAAEWRSVWTATPANAEALAAALCCSGEEFCACDLMSPTGLRASTISHHMKALVEAGLVSAEKRGLWVFYRLREETFIDAIGELRAFVADGELNHDDA